MVQTFSSCFTKKTAIYAFDFVMYVLPNNDGLFRQLRRSCVSLMDALSIYNYERLLSIVSFNGDLWKGVQYRRQAVLRPSPRGTFLGLARPTRNQKSRARRARHGGRVNDSAKYLQYGYL